MLLVKNDQMMYPPGHTGCLLTGQGMNNLRNVVRTPQYNKGGSVLNTPGWSWEPDGGSVSITNYEQRNSNGATVSFVDSSRFISELTDTSKRTVRQAAMIRMIHMPGEFLAATSPLALELTDEQVALKSVLAQAGFTMPAGTSTYFDSPAYVYRLSNLRVRDLFGDDFAPMFEFARMLRRYGPAELLLQAMQHDSEKRFLLSMSDIVGVKLDAAGDEISVLLDALELGSATELFTIINMVNAMVAIRQSKLVNAQADTSGVGLTFYYCMLDAAYLANVPYDVVAAFGAGDASGNVTLSTYSGTAIPQLSFAIPENMRIHIPTLRAITQGYHDAMLKARLLYRMLLIVRFMEYRNYPMTAETTLAVQDRRQFFELLM